MLYAGGHDIDPGRFDAAVAENIRQLGDILFQAVKGAGEQLPQVVWKHLRWADIGAGAEPFHFGPDIAWVQRSARPGAENAPAFDTGLFRVIQQQLIQLVRDQDIPGFTFAGNSDFPVPDRFHCKIDEFRHPYTGGADRLQEQAEPRITSGGPQQAEIFRLCELLFFG